MINFFPMSSADPPPRTAFAKAPVIESRAFSTSFQTFIPSSPIDLNSFSTELRKKSAAILAPPSAIPAPPRAAIALGPPIFSTIAPAAWSALSVTSRSWSESFFPEASIFAMPSRPLSRAPTSPLESPSISATVLAMV